MKKVIIILISLILCSCNWGGTKNDDSKDLNLDKNIQKENSKDEGTILKGDDTGEIDIILGEKYPSGEKLLSSYLDNNDLLNLMKSDKDLQDEYTNEIFFIDSYNLCDDIVNLNINDENSKNLFFKKADLEDLVNIVKKKGYDYKGFLDSNGEIGKEFSFNGKYDKGNLFIVSFLLGKINLDDASNELKQLSNFYKESEPSNSALLKAFADKINGNIDKEYCKNSMISWYNSYSNEWNSKHLDQDEDGKLKTQENDLGGVQLQNTQ